MQTKRWHITVAAARQYAQITGLSEGDAVLALGELSATARLARDTGPGQVDQLWRANTDVRGRRSRLELIVSVSDAHELPQLIHVRHKGRGGR